MNTKQKAFLFALFYVILAGLGLQAQPGTPAGKPNDPPKTDTAQPRFTHFSPVTTAQKAPDAKGFIQRWLILEPVKKSISRNSIFTDSYLRTTFSTDNFSTDFSIVPKNGDKVKIGNQELKWYALDSKIFNCKLFRFPYGGNQPLYGVLFWVVTVVNSPREIKNVRLSAGCNSSGMFWLNGKEALLLSGDRDLVVDNCTSSRLTLNKGKNIIRGAVINGPGMCDFCLRILDDKGEPIKDFTITCE